MISSNKNRLIGSLFAFYQKRLLRKCFYEIHLCNEDNRQKTDSSLPTILYANHSNWWDGFIAYLLSNKRWKVDDYLMMDVEQMKKYSFFKYVGVFSVDRTDPKEAIKSINYSVDLLNNSKKFLWIFPQGIMQPQDLRPIKFFSGITKIAEKLGDVNMLPVAMRYEFLMEQRPEIFIKIGEPDIINNNISDAKQFTEYLQQKLASTLDELKQSVLTGELDKFETIYKGKHSRNKTFDKLHGN